MRRFTYPSFAPVPRDGLCAVPGCRADAASDAPRKAVPGSAACTVHQRMLGRHLMLLARGWQPLQHAVGGSGAVGTSWNPVASQLRTEISDWVGFLVRTVRAHHAVPEPEIRRWPRTETRYVDGEKVVRRYEQVQYLEYDHWVTERRHTDDTLVSLAANYSGWLAGFPGLGYDLVADARGFAARFDTAVKVSPVRRALIKGAICGHILDAELGIVCPAPMFAIVDTVADDKDFGDAPWRQQGVMVCSDRPDDHRQYTASEWAEWYGR